MLAMLWGDAVAHSRSTPRRRASLFKRLPSFTCRCCPRHSGCTRHILKLAVLCPLGSMLCNSGASASVSPSCGIYSTASAVRISPDQAPRHTCGGCRQTCHISSVLRRSRSGRCRCASTIDSKSSTLARSPSSQGRILTPLSPMLFIRLLDRKRQGTKLCLLRL